MSARRFVLGEYFVSADAVFLFGISPAWEHPRVEKLDVRRGELQTFAERFQHGRQRARDLAPVIGESGQEDGWSRHHALIAPFARWTDPEDIIYLVPHGFLHYLPLHALMLEGRYLVERNPVVYCPSASVLKYCIANRKPVAEGTTVAVLGDSRGDLPGARAEAVALAKSLAVRPFLGADITGELVRTKFKEHDVIHFAGHGYFDSGRPLQSGLVVAGDDVLTAREILTIEGARATLIALSACETAVSQTRPGDELLGLVRSLLYIRTASVLVSLWRVDDHATAFLMERFYRHFWTDRRTKAEALRQAMLDTMAEPSWTSFYYWAPFILVGDWH